MVTHFHDSGRRYVDPKTSARRHAGMLAFQSVGRFVECLLLATLSQFLKQYHVIPEESSIEYVNSWHHQNHQMYKICNYDQLWYIMIENCFVVGMRVMHHNHDILDSRWWKNHLLDGIRGLKRGDLPPEFLEWLCLLAYCVHQALPKRPLTSPVTSDGLPQALFMHQLRGCASPSQQLTCKT